MPECKVCHEPMEPDARHWIVKLYCSHRCNQTAYRRRKGQRPKGSYVLRPASARFWEKVDRRDDGECWPWLGAKNEKGYGIFRSDGRNVRAHRWAYEAVVGEIPVGLEIDHLCMNPSCVNPAHMEPVTRRENLRRRDERGHRA